MLVFSFARTYSAAGLIILVLCLFSLPGFGSETSSFTDSDVDNSGHTKELNLDELSKTVYNAKARINASSFTRAGDFLRILPTVSVSRSSPVTGEGKSGETYLSVSFTASQLWGISDTRSSREETFRKAIRQIDCLEFATRTLIERRKLLTSRIWKLSQIRKSLSNPVEIASLDEKADEVTVSLQETEIAISRNFAEIEFIVIGCER